MLFSREKVMNSASFCLVLSMRYIDSVTAAMMDIVYFPPLARCGKTFLVS